MRVCHCMPLVETDGKELPADDFKGRRACSGTLEDLAMGEVPVLSVRFANSIRNTGDARGVARATIRCYERFASGRQAKRPGPVLMKRDAAPLSFTSRAIEA